MKYILLAFLLFTVFACSDDDDGSTTTGNTQEYFKYTIDGVERIFDFDVEIHLETDTSTSANRFEFNASGQQPSGALRRVSGNLYFDSNGVFLPVQPYNWGFLYNNETETKFFFSESTSSNIFVLTPSFTDHPIVATITGIAPNNVGDYLEFTFSGTFSQNGTTKTISGECRAQREADQNF